MQYLRVAVNDHPLSLVEHSIECVAVEKQTTASALTLDLFLWQRILQKLQFNRDYTACSLCLVCKSWQILSQYMDQQQRLRSYDLFAKYMPSCSGQYAAFKKTLDFENDKITAFEQWFDHWLPRELWASSSLSNLGLTHLPLCFFERHFIGKLDLSGNALISFSALQSVELFSLFADFDLNLSHNYLRTLPPHLLKPTAPPTNWFLCYYAKLLKKPAEQISWVLNISYNRIQAWPHSLNCYQFFKLNLRYNCLHNISNIKMMRIDRSDLFQNKFKTYYNELDVRENPIEQLRWHKMFLPYRILIDATQRQQLLASIQNLTPQQRKEREVYIKSLVCMR